MKKGLPTPWLYFYRSVGITASIVAGVYIVMNALLKGMSLIFFLAYFSICTIYVIGFVYLKTRDEIEAEHDAARMHAARVIARLELTDDQEIEKRAWQIAASTNHENV